MVVHARKHVHVLMVHLDVHYRVNPDANAIEAMYEKAAMAMVRVSAEDIAKDLTTDALNILIGLLVVVHAREHVHVLMVH